MFILIIFVSIILSILLILIIYKRYSVFNIVVYETQNAKKIFNYHSSKLIFRISPKIRSKLNAVLTMADPFLLVVHDELYLFYEEKSELNDGVIKGFKTGNLKDWQDLGVILNENCHLSFPFVFEHDHEIYLMPETFDYNCICLYNFTDFPYGCTLNRILMSGVPFIDSHIHKKDGIYYLFTNSSDNELKLFYSSDLMDWTIHPKSPIVTGNKYSRSAGSIVKVEAKEYRMAQDTSKVYGDNFNIFEINSLSTTDYDETIVYKNVIKKDMKWNIEGGHHFNSVFFKGRYISVFDGKRRVSVFGKISYPFFRVIQKFTVNKEVKPSLL